MLRYLNNFVKVFAKGERKMSSRMINFTERLFMLKGGVTFTILTFNSLLSPITRP